ncbi:MAG: outer membrane protein assembly factor BamD [Oceanococcaceae bacterium]
MSFRLVLTIMAAALAVGCAGNGDELPPDNPFKPGLDERRLQRADAQQLYKAAREALDSADFTTALNLYNRLDASYPFTPEATQGQLEAIYARFRNFDQEAASTAADRFLRAHPRHPHVDYVLYLRGLIHFESSATDILDLFDIDSTGRDPVDARRSFEEFGRLLQTYPDSIYAPDARRRMIYLRDRIAAHYFGIADYYAGRGACVAAIRRGEEVLNQFRDTRYALPSVELLGKCYAQLGLEQQAADMQLLLAANGAEAPQKAPERPAAPALAKPPLAPQAQQAPAAPAATKAPSATPAAKSTPTPAPQPPVENAPAEKAPTRWEIPVMEPIPYEDN